MRVLIVKTSSMGDVIHTLPAVTDAYQCIPGIRFDWVVEEAFSEIPRWHPAIDRIIPIAIRRWRKNWKRAWLDSEIQATVKTIRSRRYDYIIDAQGLIKSAVVTSLARGGGYGMDWGSCREPLASLAYKASFSIPKGRHAIDRVRDLFADVLGFKLNGKLQYGLNRENFAILKRSKPYLVFLHGTTWSTKLWEQAEWIKLAQLAEKAGFSVLLPWGNGDEKSRSTEIAMHCNSAVVPDKMSLTQLGGVLIGAAAVVGVDTGLSHLAAALETPGITLYLVTDPILTGTRGFNQTCFFRGTLGGDCRPNTEDLQTQFHVIENQPLIADNIWEYLTSKLNERPG